MPSIPAVLKILASLVTVAQPQISKFIDAKKENAELKSENEKLKKENDFLRKQRFMLCVIAALLCAAFAVSLMIIMSKEIIYV